MKKKTIAVVCAVLAVVVAGGGLLWYFLRDNAAPEDESVVYVNTVAQLTGISQGIGLRALWSQRIPGRWRKMRRKQ